MESSTIELQLWIIICLFSVVILGQVICAFYRKSQNTSKQANFSELWEKGKIDELIVQAGVKLHDRPHHVDALYYGAKAYHARGKYIEAKEYFERLIECEPSLKAGLEDTISSINEAMAANKSLNQDAQ